MLDFLINLKDFFTYLRDIFNDHVIFGVGILLIAGYFIGKLAEKVRLPAITGYIFAGLFLGDSITGLIHTEMTETLRTLTDVSLGIIAITIGSEFGLRKIRKLGKGIVLITLVQLISTFGCVTIGLTLCRMPLPYALLLGAIASATAPAATVVIIQNLRARGDFVDTLYGVVALDDAGCVILFAGVYAGVESYLAPTADAMGSAFTTLQHAFGEIFFSLLLGMAEGVAIHILTRKTKRTNERLILSLGCILLFTSAAISLKLSLLLANMMAGAVVINISSRGRRVLQSLIPLTPPLYAAFFAIAGTELNLTVLFNGWVLLLGTVYVFTRALGKYSGVWLGGVMAKSPVKVRNYLGYCMMPQAGVAIGLVLLLQASQLAGTGGADIREALVQIVNIILFAVLINELAGPPLSRWAIIRGAEL